MPRPRKCRRVFGIPNHNVFGHLNSPANPCDIIYMKIEEYESIRLIDLEGLTQEECAEKMGVARTTVQRIYQEARQKIAQSIINGVVLRIEGGDYQISKDEQKFDGCRRHRRFQQGGCCKYLNDKNEESNK